MNSQVLPNGVTVHTTGILPKLAELQVQFARTQKELAELMEMVSVAGFAFPMGEMDTDTMVPLETDQDRTARRVRELGHDADGMMCKLCGGGIREAIVQKIPCPGPKKPDTPTQVRNTLGPPLRMRADASAYEKQVTDALKRTTEEAVKEAWTPPTVAAAQERVRVGLKTITSVLAANDIPAEVHDSHGLHLIMPGHAVTPDLMDLCRRLLGEGGWTLSGQPGHSHPPADIRKRPDLYPSNTPADLPVRPVPIFRRDGPTVPAFDGSTGTRNTQIKVTDPGVPNSKE